MADVPSPEGSPSRLRRDPSFSLGGNIDAFYKGASAAIAAAFVGRSHEGCDENKPFRLSSCTCARFLD